MAGPTAVDTTGMVGLPKVEVPIGVLSRPLPTGKSAPPTATAADSKAATATGSGAAANALPSASAVIGSTRTVIPVLSSDDQQKREAAKKAKKEARALTKPQFTKEQRTAMRKAEDAKAAKERDERRIKHEERMAARASDSKTADTKTADTKSDAATKPSHTQTDSKKAGDKPTANNKQTESKSDSKSDSKSADSKSVEPAFNPNASRAHLVSDWVGWYVGVLPAPIMNEINRFKTVLASTTDVLCRARFKLEEVFQRFGVPHCARCSHATPLRLEFDPIKRAKLIEELQTKRLIPTNSHGIGNAAAARGSGSDGTAFHLAPQHDISGGAVAPSAKPSAAADTNSDSGVISFAPKKRNNCSGKKKREAREKRHAAAATKTATATATAADTKTDSKAAAAASTAPVTVTDSKSAAPQSSPATTAPAAAAATGPKPGTCNCGCGCVGGRKLHALDLGAAPGGWTAFLSERIASASPDGDRDMTSAGSIIAVDPGALHPSVSSRPNVIHYRLLLQQAMPELLKFGGCDLVVCDMCIEPLAIYGLIKQIAPVMARGAPLVLTLKFQYAPNHSNHICTTSLPHYLNTPHLTFWLCCVVLMM